MKGDAAGEGSRLVASSAKGIVAIVNAQLTCIKHVPPTTPLAMDLGCCELPNHESHEQLHRLVGKTEHGDLVHFRAFSHRIAATLDNDGNVRDVPDDETEVDEDGEKHISTHASHGCHNDRCSRRGHVWWESDKKSRWRIICSKFPRAPCPCAGICGRSCIKPTQVMSSEDLDYIEAVLEANFPPGV